MSPAKPSEKRRTAGVAAAHSLALALLLLAATGAAAQPAGWKPARNVELVVGVSPGGGIDRMARTIQKIMQDQRLVEVPVQVINKPGGGGALAQSHLQQR